MYQYGGKKEKTKETTTHQSRITKFTYHHDEKQIGLKTVSLFLLNAGNLFAVATAVCIVTCNQLEKMDRPTFIQHLRKLGGRGEMSYAFNFG